MHSFLQDIRYALRMLRKNPGFTVVMVVVLALGIGVNSATFSYVDATWLRPLPVSDPGRMVRVFANSHDSTGDHPLGPTSYVDYLDLRSQSTTLTDMVTYEHRGALLYGTGDIEHLQVDVVSSNFFSAFGLNAMLGRVFSEAEEPALRQHPGVVISYELWRQHFGSDAELPGKQVRLTNGIVTILGVMPRSFRGVDLAVATSAWIPTPVWTHITGSAGEFRNRSNRRREILAHLRPGVRLSQAQAELNTIGARLAQAYPDTNKDSHFTVVREMDTRGESTQRQGIVLLGIALAVVLIACANLANLQLARAEVRRGEIATRLALGGSRWRLMRQWLTESLVVSAFGCGLALLLGTWTVSMLPKLFAQPLVGSTYDFRLDLRVLLFTIAVTVGSTLLFGLAPALQSSKLGLMSVLRESSTPSVAGRKLHGRDFFLAAQVALSVVLLAGAGLLVRTLHKLQSLDPGFQTHQPMLMLYVVPELAKYNEAQLHNYYRTVQERLAALPGVEQASLVQRMPFSPFLGGAEKEVQIPGVQPPEGRSSFPINFNVVGPGYFSIMGTRVLRGRAFGLQDSPDSVKAVIINDTMARRFWPGQDAVGQHMRTLAGRNTNVGDAEYEIVGVVEDTKWETLTETPRPLLYFPITQQLSDGLTILLRTRTDPGALVTAARAELQRVDSNVPLMSSITLRQHMEWTLNDERNRALLASAFAGLALLLAATGIYGVLSYYLTRRTHEIGIRMALGAQRGKVLQLMLSQSLRLTLAGIVAGIAGALALTRVLANLLYGVTPTDTLTFAVATLLLGSVAVLAAYVPARRAMGVDPIVALRYE